MRVMADLLLQVFDKSVYQTYFLKVDSLVLSLIVIQLNNGSVP
ncbi:hypothetical protein SC65A3_00448 [Psychrobacter sp. SC65A.3]|nr:hypothetical protein SC65A3_00448 [Psychrobacter sp. SC65A.3]